MAAAERIGFADFQKRFKTEEQCLQYLFRQRFPDGFVRPSCGAKEYYPVWRRNPCQCKKCRKQTSVTAGTVMHRTHLSLVLWFWAIYLCVDDKRGISAPQLSRMLEIGYESAWYLLKRIRFREHREWVFHENGSFRVTEKNLVTYGYYLQQQQEWGAG